jgi:hypothetical protein
MVDKIILVPRTVHYYNVDFSFSDDGSKKEHFLKLFQLIVQMSLDKDSDRYRAIGDRIIFVQDVKFDDVKKEINGKIRLVRDTAPEILNTATDEAHEIELLESQGFVETSHFTLNYRRNAKRMAFEYNDVGPKCHEFVSYLELVGQRVKLQGMYCERMVTQDVMAELQRRMGRCAEIIVGVHRNDISTIENEDAQLGSVLRQNATYLETDVVTVKFGYELTKHTLQQSAPQRFVASLNQLFGRNPTKKLAFKKLTVRAEDTEHRNLMEVFDLLENKTKSRIRVERKPKAHVIVSADIYEKMSAEMHRLKIV